MEKRNLSFTVGGNVNWCSTYGKQHVTAKSLQSCLTLCDPIDGSPQGSPVPGILQARTLEWDILLGTLKSPTQLHNPHCTRTHIHASQLFSQYRVARAPATGFRGRRRLRRGPYLQQHHVHGPVHLGDVTQAVAPLVPLVHFVQMQQRGHEMQGRDPLCNLGRRGAPASPQV